MPPEMAGSIAGSDPTSGDLGTPVSGPYAAPANFDSAASVLKQPADDSVKQFLPSKDDDHYGSKNGLSYSSLPYSLRGPIRMGRFLAEDRR